METGLRLLGNPDLDLGPDMVTVPGQVLNMGASADSVCACPMPMSWFASRLTSLLRVAGRGGSGSDRLFDWGGQHVPPHRETNLLIHSGIGPGSTHPHPSPGWLSWCQLRQPLPLG
jgi:hypothetical protein